MVKNSSKSSEGKRIAMVCHWESPYEEEWKGGMGVYMDGLARRLSKEGYEIDFFVPRVTDHPVEQEMYSGVRIIRLNTEDKSPGKDIRNNRHMNKFGDEILRYIDSNNLDYDLVHGQYWSSHKAAKKISESRERPLIMQLHQLQLLKELTFEDLGLGYEPMPERIQQEKDAIENSDGVILVSNQQLYDLEREYYGGELPFSVRRKVAVIRNSIETEQYKVVSDKQKSKLKEAKGINPNSIVIGYHGRVDVDKAVDRLIYATHQLGAGSSEHPIDLSIVGRGSELRRLERLTKDLEMENVHFYGYQTGQELRDLVGMVDVGVIPSTYETFGLSVAELMVQGTPTVVWKGSGGPEEVVGKVSPLIEPANSIIELKNTLEELTLNPELRKEKGAQMRSRCLEKFGWDRLISEMKELYNEMSPVSSKMGVRK